MTSPRSPRGFTLVEMLVALAIVAVIGGVLVPRTASALERDARRTAEADLRRLAGAFNQFRIDTRAWPRPESAGESWRTTRHDLVGYACFYRRGAVGDDGLWQGPYLPEGALQDGGLVVATWEDGRGDGLIDPWGRPYSVFTFVPGHAGSQGAILLACGGPDGQLRSRADDVFAGRSRGDDIIQLVTYDLD